MDWYFDGIRRQTAAGEYEAVNYHRFADDIVITVSGHHTKQGWAERALLRLCEQIEPLGDQAEPGEDQGGGYPPRGELRIPGVRLQA